jgi:hypothetical protein
VAVLVSIGAQQSNATRQTEDAPLLDRTVIVKKETCKSAEKAIVYYRGKVWKFQKKLNKPRSGTYYPERLKNACGFKRWSAQKWKARAVHWHKQYNHYLYHYAWWIWLPDKWQRIGACETGYGKRPGQWTWNSGTYQGAFGFYHGSWDAFKPAGAPSEAYLATPRQQYQAALNIYNRYGLSGWGCRDA